MITNRSMTRWRDLHRRNTIDEENDRCAAVGVVAGGGEDCLGEVEELVATVTAQHADLRSAFDELASTFTNVSRAGVVMKEPL